MQESYIKTFASHINDHCKIHVKVAQDGEVLRASTAYVTPQTAQILQKNSQLYFHTTHTKEHSFNPDINELFHSCAKLGNKTEILAFILTGIGDDGAQGLLSLCKINAECIAESEESAVVYGMPLRAKEVSQNVRVESLDQIIETIKRFGA